MLRNTQEPVRVLQQMLAALSVSTKTASAVLAGLWDDEMCKGVKALPQLAAAPDVMQAQTSQAGRVQPSELQLQPQTQQPVAVPPQQQSPIRSAVTASIAASVDQARQPRQRRPSRSAPVSPVRGSSSPPTSSARAGYSSDAYWDSRYAERSTHFDWFYNYSALVPLINKAVDKQGPCLHVGCGNSGLSLGMARDGYQVRFVSAQWRRWSLTCSMIVIVAKAARQVVLLMPCMRAAEALGIQGAVPYLGLPSPNSAPPESRACWCFL